MTETRDLAAWIGPVLVVVAVSEACNLPIFAGVPPPFVYLNGMILFAAGFGIIRVHNRWRLGRPLAVTLTGWLVAALGLARMVRPQLQAAASADAVWGGIAVAFALGAVLTYQGYAMRP